MTIRYEVWLKQKMISGREMPEEIFYTPDVAIREATRLSRGTYKTFHWKPAKPKLQWVGGLPFIDQFDGENVEVELPNMYAVVMRDSKETTIRGYGIGGEWHYATNCKRCNNTGLDDDGLNCYSCKGASVKKIV